MPLIPPKILTRHHRLFSAPPQNSKLKTQNSKLNPTSMPHGLRTELPPSPIKRPPLPQPHNALTPPKSGFFAPKGGFSAPKNGLCAPKSGLKRLGSNSRKPQNTYNFPLNPAQPPSQVPFPCRKHAKTPPLRGFPFHTPSLTLSFRLNSLRRHHRASLFVRCFAPSTRFA
jgi:hypothetical protein